MKRLLFILTIFFIIGLTSCEKDYGDGFGTMIITNESNCIKTINYLDKSLYLVPTEEVYITLKAGEYTYTVIDQCTSKKKVYTIEIYADRLYYITLN